MLNPTQPSRREFLRGAGMTVAGAAIQATGTSLAPSPSTPTEVAQMRKIRGLMVDAARVPERLDYYRRVIDFCARWRLNTLQFRLADDQGSALRFASVPGLITHKNAFTPEQLRDLAEYGQRQDVDLIPEIESFGHTGYITRAPTFSHLLDRDPKGSSTFSGVSPLEPAVLDLMKRLYEEVASIFPSKYLHAGCDEVNWGGSEHSRQVLQRRSRAEIWADYLNALNGITVDLGTELIVWGDFVAHKEPQILGLLDKRIIIMDWDYDGTAGAPLKDTLSKVAAHGARAIGAPALSCYRWGPRIGTEQLRNVDAVADAYLARAETASLGVVVTNWVPSRYIQNSIWDCLAYASVALNEGTAAARRLGLQRFVEKHYQAPWSEEWKEVFDGLYCAAPYRDEEDKGHGLKLLVPWASDAQLAQVILTGTPATNPFNGILRLLILLEPKVRANLADYHAFVLCIQYLEKLFWRDRTVAKLARQRPLDDSKARSLIQAIAARDKALADALLGDWEMGRFADSEAASRPVFDLQASDQLFFGWKQASKYSAFLAKNPDRFCALLKGANPPRLIPGSVPSVEKMSI